MILSWEKNKLKHLKNALASVLDSKNPLEYYRENLSKDILEERRKQIFELNLLIQMIS